MRWLAVVVLAGCVELGVVSDGTSISVGKPSHGYLIDGVRLPDHGDGFLTREVWRARDNRFGTDELIDLVTAVAHRMRGRVRDVQLVVADLSGKGGGERIAFHRSHQTGRDVDLLYYMRDAGGQPFEPDAMHVFDARARATDGTGITVDIPRTWALVKELLTAPEAPVQWVFMYEPIARRLIEYAEATGEPEAVIARARKAVRQPGDSARHDDHLHVRIYCSPADKAYGCVDLGPMELYAERAAEPSPAAALIAALSAGAAAPPSNALAQAPEAPGQASGPGQSVGASAQALVSPASSAVASLPGPVVSVGGGLAASGSLGALPVATGALAGLGTGGPVAADGAVSTALATVQQRLGRLLRGRLEPHLFGR